MGWPEIAGKCPKNWKTSCDSRWPPPPLRRRIPALPAAVGLEISRSASSGCPPPIPPARVQ